MFIGSSCMENVVEPNFIEKIKEYSKLKQNEFLSNYSPWHKKNPGESVIERFCKNSEKFSWLDIYEKDIDKKKTDKEKDEYYSIFPANIHYGVPKHVTGNFDEATLFVCLTNPHIGISDTGKSEDFKEECSYEGKKHYGDCFKKNCSEDPSSDFYNVDSDNLDKLKENIRNHIININDSEVSLELKKFVKAEINDDNLKKYYYLSNYFYKILTKGGGKKDLIELVKKNKNLIESLDKNKDAFKKKLPIFKICNLEAFPFRSQNPGYRKNKKGVGNILLSYNDDVTLLAARIILRRIGLYLSSPTADDRSRTEKPIFIFRRFNDVYKNSLEYVIENDLGIRNFEKVIIYLEEEGFFYYFIGKDIHGRSKGLISQGNVKDSKGENLKEVFDDLFKSYALNSD